MRRKMLLVGAVGRRSLAAVVVAVLVPVAAISGSGVAGSMEGGQYVGRAGVAPDTVGPDGRIVSTSGPVVSLAADGARVAAAVGGHVVVWDVPRRTVAPFHSSRDWIEEVALADNRVAWISSSQPGNHVNYFVETATTSAPRVRLLSPLDEGGDSIWSATGGLGTWATNIVGDGNLVALNVFVVCTPDPSTSPSCPDRLQTPEDVDYALESSDLVRVTARGIRRVASGAKTLRAVSADTGRILVLRYPWPWSPWSNRLDGSLAIYRADGRVLQTIEPTFGAILDARLQGNHVAVQTRKAITVVDAATGETLRTWPLPSTQKNVRLQDIHGGIVVYVSGHTIHLLRLRDGHQAAIAVRGRDKVLAQLEAPGLSYTYLALHGFKGRIAFIPSAELARRIR